MASVTFLKLEIHISCLRNHRQHLAPFRAAVEPSDRIRQPDTSVTGQYLSANLDRARAAERQPLLRVHQAGNARGAMSGQLA